MIHGTIPAPKELMHISKNKLIELFAETNNNNDEDIYTVRGWIMEALEAKMSESEFDSWLDIA